MSQTATAPAATPEQLAADAEACAISISALLCTACGVLSSIRKTNGRYALEALCQVCVENRDYANRCD